MQVNAEIRDKTNTETRRHREINQLICVIPLDLHYKI